VLNFSKPWVLGVGLVAIVIAPIVTSGIVLAATTGNLTLVGIQLPIFNVTFEGDGDSDFDDDEGFSEASGPEDGFFVFRLMERFNTLGGYKISVRSQNLSDGRCTINGNNKPCVVDENGVIAQLSYDFIFDENLVNEFVDGEATVSGTPGEDVVGTQIRKGERIRRVLLRLDGDAGLLASPDYADTLTFTVAGP